MLAEGELRSGLASLLKLLYTPKLVRKSSLCLLLIAATTTGVGMAGGWPPPAAQEPEEIRATRDRVVELTRYLPADVGDMWLYRDRVADDDWLLTVTEASRRGATKMLRWDDSSGDYRLLSLSREEGLRLHQLHFFDGPALLLEEPLLLLPSELRLGDEHRARGRYVDLGAADETEGEIEVHVVLAAFAPIETPAGTFADCLLLRWKILLSDEFGDREIEVETALAESTGIVRLLGRIFGTDPGGQRRELAAIHRVLVESRLGGLSLAVEGIAPPDG